MDDRTAEIAALPHESGDTDDLVYRIVDGDDPDWLGHLAA